MPLRAASQAARNARVPIPIVKRRQAGTRGGQDRLVALGEFAAQAVDMDVVDTGETVDLLVDAVVEAQHRGAREQRPAIAVAVDEEREFAAQRQHRGRADPVQAEHGAVAARFQNRFGTAAHLVEIAGDVEGMHDALAGAVGMAVERSHHGRDPGVERCEDRVRAELIILDEVDAALGEFRDDLRSLLRQQADARLDDGADGGEPVEPEALTRPRDAETRAREGGDEFGRQIDIQQADAGEFAQLAEIAANRRHQRLQVGPDIGIGPDDLDSRLGVACPRRSSRAGQARHGNFGEALDAGDPRPCPRRHRIGLGGELHERPGRLLAGNGSGRLLDRQRRLDQVVSANLSHIWYEV